MALNITCPTTCCLANSPILATVTATGVPSQAIFYRLAAECTITGGQKFTFSIPRTVQTDVSAIFDFQSCAQAAFARKQIKTSGFTPSTVALTIDFYESYMIGTTPFDKQNITRRTIHSIDGGFTDMERALGSTLSWLTDGQLLSRKPPMEITDRRFPLLTPVFNLAGNSAQTQSDTLAPSPQAQTVRGKQVVVAPDYANPVYIIFRNGFGMEESYVCQALESLSIESKSTVFTRVADRSFSSVNRTFSKKMPIRSSLKLSSGPLTRTWANWFASELLATDQAYIKMGIDGLFLPVTIENKESIPIYDRLSADSISIDFDVKLSVTGAI